MLIRIISCISASIVTVSTLAATETYVCQSIDPTTNTEYRWNIEVIHVRNNIYDIFGVPENKAWSYRGRGFKYNDELTFYWKLTDADNSIEQGVVHYKVKSKGNVLSGTWASENAEDVNTERCFIQSKRA